MGRLFLSLFFLLLGVTSFASGYSSSENIQKVRLIHKGPAILANISSGYMSKYILAYSNAGYLAHSEGENGLKPPKSPPKSIEAVISSECFSSRGGRYFQQTVVQLGPEWHGAGYSSFPLDMWNHVHSLCYSTGFWKIEVAFSDSAGRWDSQYGQNYVFTSEGLSQQKPAEIFDRPPNEWESRGQTIHAATWQFIADELQR